MPYRWTDAPDAKTLTLWPHQSMTAKGFAWFIGITSTMLALPLLAVLGTAIVWMLLVFFLIALWGVWRAIMVNRRHRSIHEALVIRNDQVHLTHVPVKGPPLTWQANPYWTTVHLGKNGPVENYLTMKGNGREVELGAFLTPDERQHLFEDLNRAIRPG